MLLQFSRVTKVPEDVLVWAASFWRKIITKEDQKWTKKYHDPDPNKKCFGGKVIIKMKNGSLISDEIKTRLLSLSRR